MPERERLEDELVSVEEIMDVIAGNVEVEDLREFKRAGVILGHA